MTRYINIYPLMLLPLLFIISACDDTPPSPAKMQIKERPVATVYKVKSGDKNGQVGCYRLRQTEMSEMTEIKHDQLVKIVTVEEGLRQFQGELWLHIYPRLTHRPSCYVNVNNLIPYS